MNEETNDPGTKTCLECGLPLGAGRSDRKFCNDSCRTAYNNRRRADTFPVTGNKAEPDPIAERNAWHEQQIREITGILYANRVKLINIFGPGDHIISLNDFYGCGVNLKYFTSEYKEEREGYIYRMCFDHGYHIAGDRVYLIYAPTEICFI